MDLKKCCKFWYISVLGLIFISNLILASTTEKHTCSPYFITSGYTIPKGDIVIQYGDALDITCTLYDNVTLTEGPGASSKLAFTRNHTMIPQEMIEIVDEKSIRLHIEKPPKVEGDSYTCLFKGQAVCMNIVSVGIKPQPVTDFDCIGYNFNNLTCTWTAPQNYVRTNYTLTFTLRGRASRYMYTECPEIEVNKNKMSCFWNITTKPQYRQVHEVFNFLLTAENIFGKINTTKIFKHYEHVLSDPPEKLTVLNKTTNSVYLSWEVPFLMQTFPPGVHHRVLYQCEFGEQIWNFGGLIKDDLHKNIIYYNLTGLMYPHNLCDIRVSIRTAVALANDESMWSKNASVTVRTMSAVPDGPPRTNIGSFETIALGNNLQVREAYIYWQQLPEVQRNGPNFKYIVTVDDDDDNQLKPIEITNAYAKFINLSISKSYKFNIWSSNTVGRSINKSTVFIPKQTERISEPMSFTKVEFGEGQFELSWEPPKLLLDQFIENYTIFWCNNDRDRPYQCTGELNWETLPGHITVYNQTVSPNSVYQFAISANTHNSSSGMLWAACTVLHNKIVGKMKNVWINRVGSTFIDVGWKLDCADRIGSVEGFIIYYCPIISPIQTECKGPQKNITLYGDTSVLGGNITNLTPYTTYMLTVAVITKHTTYSQQSDPLFNTTLEAAPSTPPLKLKVTEVTNSSVSLEWLPPSATNGVLKFYIIYYNGFKKTIDPQTSYTITDLTSYEDYSISLVACTIMCSNASHPIHIRTNMSYPGPIRRPSIIFQNDSYVIVGWDKPTETRGRNDYYEVQVKQKYYREDRTMPTINVTSRRYVIENCGDDGKYNTFYVSVRAVNIFNDKPHEGPWSDELESYCRTSESYIIYILLPFGLLFIISMIYLSNKLYKYCQMMRDVQVKLPPGLAPAISDHTLVPWNTTIKHQDEHNSHHHHHHHQHSPADEELLLEKLNERRHLSGDSSGCSSAQDSVTSSLDTNTHISTSSSSDSGTDQQIVANYCVLGVDDLNNYNQKIDNTSSSYVPIVTTIKDPNNLPYISCDAVSNQSSPYVMTGGDVVKTINPGYIPFNQTDTIGKNSGYVIAGIKNCNGYIPFNQTDTVNNKNTGYVVAGIKNCKLD